MSSSKVSKMVNKEIGGKLSVQHCVEFVYPDPLYPEDGTPRHKLTEVAHRDPMKIKLPKGAYGFRLFDVQVTVRYEDELIAERKNNSGWYYKGKAITLDELEGKGSEKKDLISYFKRNGYERAVLTEHGGTTLLKKGDMLISEIRAPKIAQGTPVGR